VTPSSKVVGDLALHLVGADVSVDEFAADPGRFDIPDSVIGFLRGDLGTPAGGWPEPLREKALAGRGTPTAVVELSVQDEKALGGDPELRKSTLNRLLFPGPTKEFLAHREQFGDTSGLSANQFFYGLRQGDEHRVTLEKGVELVIGLEAISEPDDAGMRTVMGILNGQLRPVSVRDRSVAAQAPAAEKADRSDPSHVAAPFSGVVTLTVAEGDSIVAAQPIATIEAMKMEASITAPRAGTVTRLAINTVQQVEGGDLLAVISVGDTTNVNLNSGVSGQAAARPSAAGNYVADAFLGAGAGAVVSRTINRGCSTHDTASVRPLSSRSTTAATARLACSRGSWLTEVRSMWLSCASRLLSSRDRDTTGHVDPGAQHNPQGRPPPRR
jgi:pyruvate carboxylase